jgi:hypothetical protein
MKGDFLGLFFRGTTGSYRRRLLRQHLDFPEELSRHHR